MAKLKEKKIYIKIRSRFRVFGCHQDWKRSARAGGAVGEDVSALPGQMIASSSVTLRARSSRSACKSWNICKLMSYQRAVTVGGGWRRGALSEGGFAKHWVLGPGGCSWLFLHPAQTPALSPNGQVRRECEAPLPCAAPSAPPSQPDLWPLPKADPATGLLLTMNTDHSLED